jgi:perosamine synthetase
MLKISSNKKISQMEPWIDEKEEQAVLRVLKSGWITEADETKKFEQQIADFVGSKYCSVVSNGTVSLFIALKALGIRVKDEVIVPDMTMVASINAIVMAGATPVVVDIEKKTLCLDLSEVERKITSKTKAIMPVAFNGRSPDMEKLLKIAKKNKLFIVEDAAQALGSYYKGKHLGTFGEIGSFSFSTPKIITTGQGGALVTNDKFLYEKIIRLKDFGRINRNSQEHDEIGLNFKFSDILAAVGVVQMEKLPWRIKRKRAIYSLYVKELGGVKQVNFIPTDLSQTTPWFIDIFVLDQLKLKHFLKENNVGTREFYPAIHTTKPYNKIGKFPNSFWVSQQGLWLPSSSFLSDEDVKYVCARIKEYYDKD